MPVCLTCSPVKMETVTLSHSPSLFPFSGFLYSDIKDQRLEIVKSDLEIRKEKLKMVKGLSKSQTGLSDF